MLIFPQISSLLIADRIGICSSLCKIFWKNISIYDSSQWSPMLLGY